MNECGLVLSDSPLVGELSQEGGCTGDRGAILHNLYNRSFDMCDLTVCVRASSVEDDPLPRCLLEPFQVKTPIRHLEKQGSTKGNKQVFRMRRKEMEKGFVCIVCQLEEKKLWRGDQFPELWPFVYLCWACANNHTYILPLLCARPFSTGLITFWRQFRCSTLTKQYLIDTSPGLTIATKHQGSCFCWHCSRAPLRAKPLWTQQRIIGALCHVVQSSL